MSEAVILGVIREVESDSDENQSIDSDYKMILLNELRMMLGLLRDKESGVRCSLDHLVADFTEMTQLSTNPTTQRVIAYARDWLSKIENWMMRLGFDEARRLEKDCTQVVGLEIIREEQNRLHRVAMWACLNLSAGKCMADVVVDMIVKFVRLGETKRYYRNMSEAIISWANEQLCSFRDSKTEGDHKSITGEIINELEQIVIFFNKSEPGELDMLNYLLADFAEMAQLTVTCTINNDERYMKTSLGKARDWLRKLRKRIMEFGGGEEASVGEEGVVVGLEKEVELISRVILNEPMRFKLIHIKGMLGSGKTTLARQVYNHPAVIGKFKRRAWISLSSDTSANEVLLELIHKFGDSSLLEEMDNKSLQRWLRCCMQGMPYFIVLDNVPKEMFLASISSTLPNEGNGSRLMFTSRYVIENTYPYSSREMKALESDQSWQLFLKTINKFTNDENKFSKELERKAREMLKQCGGLPIAIIDVARQKADQKRLGMEWEAIFESIDLGRLLKLVEPMYHKLDTKVKPYFWHLSLFKENAIMREEKLQNMWIASGACERKLSPSNMRTWMIDNPFDSLANDSIIYVVKYGSRYCEMRKCRLNPLLHMLSIEIAEKEIGLEIIRSNGNSRLSQNPCHRVIHCGREKFSHSTSQNGKHLISLIFHGGGGYLDNVCSSYWESFELLKVLDMEDFGVKTLSKTTGTMTNLRYLGLRNNYLNSIPHSLGGLEQLEVLDIAQNFMVEVPDIIWRMGTLRHLYMSDVVCSEPLKIDVWNLTTVTYISIYDWVFEVLSVSKESSLRLLGIEDIDENSDVSKLFASLTNVYMYMRLCLTLRGFRFRSMPCLDQIGVILIDKLYKLKLDGCLARLPKTLCELVNVGVLVLVNTCLGEDPMPVLEKVSFLQRLKLRNAYTGREMVIKDNGFPCLSVLNINELWNLRNIQVEKGAMPKLEKLELKNCPHLETLPQEIGSMKYLWKFEMLTTRHIATKIKNSGLISKILEVDTGPLSSMA